MLQSQQLLSSNFPFPLSHPHNPSLYLHFSSSPLNFLCRPSTLHSVSAHVRARPEPWLAQVSEPITTNANGPVDGPIELPPSTPSIFATFGDPSLLQVATSVLLTRAISVFLFQSLRRRAKRAKELKFRSSGAKKSLKEAIENLKAMTLAPIEAKDSPSPVQTPLGYFFTRLQQLSKVLSISRGFRVISRFVSQDFIFCLVELPLRYSYKPFYVECELLEV